MNEQYQILLNSPTLKRQQSQPSQVQTQEQKDIENAFDLVASPLDVQRTKSDDCQSGELRQTTTFKRNMTSYEEQINLPIPQHYNSSLSNDNIKVTLYRQSYPRQSEHLLPKQRQFDMKSSRYSTSGLSMVEQSFQFLESIEFSRFQRWILLIITAILNAIVPCWMTVDIQCEGMTRNAWRFFTMSTLMIPFVMMEQRWVRSEDQKIITFLKFKKFKKIYMCSFNHCIWVLFGVMATKLTAGAHSFCFLRLKFFIISLVKLYKNEECHEGQIGGTLLVTIGILMMFWDSMFLPVTQHPSIPYLQNTGWQRLLGDIAAIAGCLVLFKLEKKFELPKGPSFTIVCLFNYCISFNLILFANLMGLNQFSLDPYKGIFGLFTSCNFVSIFYVSIMLGLNLIIANVLVNQIFSVFIRNIASCFEIVITSTTFHFFAIQESYSGLSNLGLCFLVPGMMMIVGGQGSLQKLQMRINEKIYTCDNIAKGSEKEIMEAVLRHVLAVEPTQPLQKSRTSINAMEVVDEERQSLETKSKSE